MGATPSVSPQLAYIRTLKALPPEYTPDEADPAVYHHPELPCLRAYRVMLNREDLANCEKSIRVRRNHPQELLQMEYGEVLKGENEYAKLNVWVEMVRISLQQVTHVHYSDMMAIFWKAFRGFKVLFQQFGPFAPMPKMIAFNGHAEVKVWANCKYSKSTPQVCYQVTDQQKMVEALVKIFENKVDVETVPLDSHGKKFQFKGKTFQEVIGEIESRVQHLELIPTKIKCIQLLLDSGRKFDENEIISFNSDHYVKKVDKTVKFHYGDSRDAPRDHSSKVKFSYAGQTHRGNSKVKFTASSPHPHIKFNLVNPQDGEANKDNKVNFSMNSPRNPEVRFAQPHIVVKPHSSQVTFANTTDLHQTLPRSSLVTFANSSDLHDNLLPQLAVNLLQNKPAEEADNSERLQKQVEALLLKSQQFKQRVKRSISDEEKSDRHRDLSPIAKKWIGRLNDQQYSPGRVISEEKEMGSSTAAMDLQGTNFSGLNSSLQQVSREVIIK